MRRPAILVASALLLAACSSAGSEPPAPSAAPPASPSADSRAADAPLADLNVVCSGDGAPTIVLVAGLNTSGDVFTGIADRLAGTTRTCWYDRAGIGSSPSLAADAPDPSPGSAAADLRASLAAQGVEAPYVVLGWSYGGLVAQAYAAAYPADLAGLVLEDTSVREQFTEAYLVQDDEPWMDGGREVDEEALKEQLADLDFGDIPLAVLSQDHMTGPLRKVWFGHHDELARASTDAVHVVAVAAGHAIHEDAPYLVVATLEAVWGAAANGSSLGQCDARFTDALGRCR